MVILLLYGIFSRNDDFPISVYCLIAKHTKPNQRTLWFLGATYSLIVTKHVRISVYSRLLWCFQKRYSQRIPDHPDNFCVDTFLLIRIPGIVDLCECADQPGQGWILSNARTFCQDGTLIKVHRTFINVLPIYLMKINSENVVYSRLMP